MKEVNVLKRKLEYNAKSLNSATKQKRFLSAIPFLKKIEFLNEGVVWE